jgi:glycosyltransferase involved in cell wall biosynthesis
VRDQRNVPDKRIMVRVFYLDGCYDGTIGGSHTCLVTLVLNLDRTFFYPIVGFYQDHWVAQSLRDAGIETRVLRWSMPVDLTTYARGSQPWARLALPALSLVQKSINLVAFLLTALKRAAFLRKERVSLLHLNNSFNTNHDWMLGAWLARVKVVSHERGVSARMSVTLRLIGHTVEHFICVSKLVFDHLDREGIPLRKMSVVYDGIDFERFKADKCPASVRKDLGLTAGQKVVGVLGNVKEWKGQETLVRATAVLANRWDDVVCLLIGTANEDEPYVNHLKAIARELDIEGRIRFLGFRKDASAILQAMDVVCHTSITPEPFGMVNLEAMYLRRPVVSTRLGGPLEVITDGKDGVLVEPGDSAKLAEHVDRILSDDKLAQRLGDAARGTVITRFDALNTVLGIQSIYHAALRGTSE